MAVGNERRQMPNGDVKIRKEAEIFTQNGKELQPIQFIYINKD
jgi:hypothetical protein